MSLDIERIVREEIRHILRAHLEGHLEGLASLGVDRRTYETIGRDTEPAPPPVTNESWRVPKSAAPSKPKPKASKPPPVKVARPVSSALTGKEICAAALEDVTAGGWTSAQVLAANIGNGVTARQAGQALQKLAKDGKVKQVGVKRATRYFLPDRAPADAAQWAEGPTEEILAPNANGSP